MFGRGQLRFGRAWVVVCVAVILSWFSPMYAEALTPQERCEQDTAAYNQVQAAAWRASHPGQEVPEPAPWPPYRCAGIPGNNNAPGGFGSGGSFSGGSAAGEVPSGGLSMGDRPQRLDEGGGAGAADPSSGSGWSENGQSVGAPRQQITPMSPSDNSAEQSARSNVRVPSRSVGSADSAPSQAVGVSDGNQGRTQTESLGGVVSEVGIPDDYGASTPVQDEGAGDRARSGGESVSGGSLAGAAQGSSSVSGRPSETGSSQDSASEVEAVSSEDQDSTGGVAGGGATAALVGTAVGAARRSRRGGRGSSGVFGRVHEFGWVQPDGDAQRFMVVPDRSAPHEHSFDVAVPEGGALVANPDGSADVVDSHGRVVDHVRRPWAFDATGRPVDTWYEIDNERGQLVQKVDPDSSVVYPIVADPEQDKSRVSDESVDSVVSDTQVDAKVESTVEDSVAVGDTQLMENSAAENSVPGAEGGMCYPSDDYLNAVAQSSESGEVSLTESGAEQERLDAQLPTRQADFVGPVTAEDAAGRKRNQEKVELEETRAAEQSGGSEVTTPEEVTVGQAEGGQMPVERDLGPVKPSTGYGVCELSTEGDPITRNANGDLEDVYPVGTPDRVTKTVDSDGSITITQSDKQTTYYSVPENVEPGELVIESSTYDRAENETRQVFRRGDRLIEQQGPGQPDFTGSGGVRLKPVPVATPNEPVAGGEPIPITGEVTITGGAAPEPNESEPGISIADMAGDATPIADGAGKGIKNETENPGRHRDPSGNLPGDNQTWQTVGKVAKGAGTAGDVISVTQAGINAYHDPDHVGHYLGESFGGAAGGAAGAYIGAEIGAFGGPAAPVTIPLGAAIGAYVGSKAGEPAGRAIGDSYDEYRSEN